MTIKVQFKQMLGETDFDIKLKLPCNGISALFGRSGAGKTTLINIISGLVTPRQGYVAVGEHVLFDSEQGINLPTHKRGIGYVFQDSRLFPHYSVQGNLLYGVKEKDDEYFDAVTELLSIKPLLKRFPVSLSGGEKQRVAIARALLSKPNLLLMDEPLASLDMPRKREVMPFLEELSEKVNIPIIYVTHSLQEILRLAQHLAIIDQGKISSSGKLEEVWASHAMRPWQSFSDQSSLFEGRIAEHHERYALTCISLAPNVFLWVQKIDGTPDTPIRLQVRANDVSITLEQPKATSIRNILPAIVDSIEALNAADDKQSINVSLKLDEKCYLWATITPWALDDLNLKVGSRVFAQIKGVSVTQKDMALAPH
ncbi:MULTISPECIES: molybdenum ABC transporter ATP-binding protein ModC [Vibrio]|uniref:molybdenum ABC transporter ATP-binding protein ModC n=1 Tax=Vibrio TaxID=662 RepID=UPI001CDC1182|nr:MULTISPECIES: molybdenum ABC transporter ATP-binding protein ModC [Vibrio]EIK0770563.1 molybdenum ABC transporter ATP-binding protein ModC [Vibrio alginolyticus]MCA2487684.1 molybdenum ABC transporter ATP-binding protein ModC [Vibrio alginolyticus]MDW1780418.1 molybdenum ABC transporter ATP-binding protein ModC [Vibrio sp. Vb2134]MDW2084786.1 molybdenum ABC transporter ATP-binding protein ModC [Vibrio sp. 2134-1]MDY8147277.1 molybdenum ABC transporter ATP-binding protein ModC [Vibrio sp. PB